MAPAEERVTILYSSGMGWSEGTLRRWSIWSTGSTKMMGRR